MKRKLKKDKVQNITYCIRCPNCRKIHEAHIHCECNYPIYIKLDKKREVDKEKEVESLRWLLNEQDKTIEEQKNQIKELIDKLEK